MFDLQGTVALVTGGTRNIGLACAIALAQAGADVAVTGHTDEDQLTAAREALEATGRRHLALLTDNADPSAIRRCVEAVERDLGPIDILVNNAAIRPHSDWRDVTAEAWDHVMAVNLRAPFIFAQCVLDGMMERGFGRVINMSGIDAFWGKAGRIPVTTSKGGIIGFTRALAQECGGSGVTVNAVVPGTIDTHRHSPEWYPDLDDFYRRRIERTPVGRLGRPEEVAAAVLYLASREAGYVTGQSLMVTGGAFPLVKC